MPIRIPLQHARPSLRLAHPVIDADGRLVAGVGTSLTDRIVRILRNMALQSVVVADSDDVAEWERVRPLCEEIGDLERRFAGEPASEPLAELRGAITRYLDRRARARAADDPSDDQSARTDPGA